jgi:hypothetical protein
MSGVLSSLFDLSGFFFMFTLNLLVICLICYYFKRRMETLENAQMEQSKILRTYIQETNNINNKSEARVETIHAANEHINNSEFNDHPFKKIEINQFTLEKNEDSQSEDTSDEEYEEDELGENVELIEENNNTIKVLRLNQDSDDESDDENEQENDEEDNNDMDEKIVVKEDDNENTKNISLEIDYNKYTAKELKAICKEKNLTGFNNLKKTELVELLKKNNQIKQEVIEEITIDDNLDVLELPDNNNENTGVTNKISLEVLETE